MQSSPERLDSRVIEQQLSNLQHKLEESSERRDRNMKARVQPIKEHLMKITEVIKSVHKSEEQQERDFVIKYSVKDKKIIEARKRRKKLNMMQRNLQEMNLSQGKCLVGLSRNINSSI